MSSASSITTKTIEALRAALEAGDGPASGQLERAVASLDAKPDRSLLEATTCALERADLSGLAACLWRRHGPTVDPAGWRTCVERLARRPSGFIPWQTRGARRQENLAALATVDPVLGRELDACDDPDPRYSLLRTPGGNEHVLFGGLDVPPAPAGGFTFAIPFADHQQQARDLDLTSLADGAVALIAGVPTAPVFERLVTIVTANGYTPPIEIIEPDLDLLHVWLHMVDIVAPLRAGRLRIFGGGHAISAYERARVEHHWWRRPSHVLRPPRPHRAAVAVDESMLSRVDAAVEVRRQEWLATWPWVTVPKTAAAWAQRLVSAGHGDQPRLRVCGLTTRFSTVIGHAMRDLGHAFQRAGCDFDLLTESATHDAEVDTWTAFAVNNYDLIVVMNHLRHGLGTRIPANVPMLTWSQDFDPGIWSTEAGAGLGELDLVATRGTAQLAGLYGFPSSRLIGTSNLTDTKTYDATPVAEPLLAPYRCAISYVGHGSALPETILAGLGPGPVSMCLSQFLDGVRTELAERGWLRFMDRLELLLDCAKRSGLAPGDGGRYGNGLYQLADRLYDRVFRHEALGWCAAWAEARGRSFRIHGRGWEDHPVLAPFAQGPVENGEPLRRVYQGAAINIQINGYDSLHPRLLDAVAAGGLVLTRYNPADFHNVALAEIRDFIDREAPADLDALVRCAASEPALADAISRAEVLSGLVVATTASPARRRNVSTLREIEVLPMEITDDTGYFASLATMSFTAARVAGQLDGFAGLTFDSAAALHGRLDELVDDPVTRASLAAPIRNAVLAEDTYDRLVERVLDRLGCLDQLDRSSESAA